MSIFVIRDPFGTKYIYQYKVGLSSLSYHKKRNKLTDIPNDIGIETTAHFLIDCPLFNVP